MIFRTVTAVTCFGLMFVFLASAAVIADTGTYSVAILGELAGLFWGSCGIVTIALEGDRKMSGNIQWVQVNSSLTMSHRMSSGYEYRIREMDNGKALLIAEGRISDGKPPERRQECADTWAAFRLADQWESEK